MSYLLETPRLYLREFLLEDDHSMYELNADPLVIQYTGDAAFPSPAAARRFLARYQRETYRRYGMGRLAVLRREDDSWLGWCGLKYHPDAGKVDLGFRFFRRYWGNGYATEAGRACLEYGFRQLRLEVIVAHALKVNLASIRVLEKLGFSGWAPLEFEGQPGVQAAMNNPYF